MAISGSGALGGAAAGASAGSAAGPYGAVIGGVIGGVAGLFSGAGNPQYDSTSTQLANISSSEWQEAANMMYPAQQQLINYAENPNYINQQRAQGISDADQSFSAQQSDQTRQMGLMGVNPTSAQSSAISKSQALGKAESEAAAGNAAAQGAYQNQQAAFRGLN